MIPRSPSRLPLVAIAVFLAVVQTASAPAVTRVDLGALPLIFPTDFANSRAVAINDNGWIAGTSSANFPEVTHPFVWVPGMAALLDLGSLGGMVNRAMAMNASGQVVGFGADGNFRGFFWGGIGHTLIELGTLSGPPSIATWFTIPYAINASGEVVGYSTIPGQIPHAFRWTESTGIEDLGTLAGGLSWATAINDAGDIAGCSDGHAFLWTAANAMSDLGTLGGSGSCAFAVTADRQVVGNSATAGDTATHAFSWTPSGGMIDLGTLGGANSRVPGDLMLFPSVYRFVNAHGQVVGYSETASGETHAFSWTPSGGMIDLGTLGGSFSRANAVNDAGEVVGVSDGHAFSWTAGDGMIDLGTLGGSQSEALAVNSSGQIVGWSELSSPTRRDATLWQVQRQVSITSITASPDVLWPPNHKLVPVTIAVSASDGSGVAPACSIASVTSSEGTAAPGQSDWTITGPLTVALRAERAGQGEGRVYTIAVTCANAAGIATSADVSVQVPHDRGR